MQIAQSIAEKIRLQSGVEMPQFGLGVWRAVEGPETYNAVEWALKKGYRKIDTAALYDNERSVGEAVRHSGIAREDIFITTKVWNNMQGYDQTLAAFEQSLGLLGTECVDLYLVHYPVPDKFLDTWKAMESLLEQKVVRAIGVSNFHEHHLEKLLAACSTPPDVNQIELHPYLSQKPLIAYNAGKGIATEAWAPIAKGRVLGEEAIVAISAKHGKTPAQVVLRWELEQGIVVIPKSVHEARIEENAGIFDFELSPEETRAIDALERGGRIGTHPDEMKYE